MFVKGAGAQPNKGIGKIAKIYRSLSINNFEHLQTLEGKMVRKNVTPMSENLLLCGAFLGAHPGIKVCLLN